MVLLYRIDENITDWKVIIFLRHPVYIMECECQVMEWTSYVTEGKLYAINQNEMMLLYASFVHIA